MSDLGGRDDEHDAVPGEPTDRAVAVDDSGGGDATSAAERRAGPEDGRGWRGWLWLLPWILLALAIAATVALAIQVQELRAQEVAREDVERAAGTFMLTLTTWDGTEGMSETREELRAAGTERFAGEVDELFGTTEDLAGLAEIGARSEGDVRRLFVQEVDGDSATALVVVVQQLSSDASETETNARYAEIELLEREGGWLVDDVELLVDVSDQQAGTGGSPVPSEDSAEDAGETDGETDGDDTEDDG